MKIWLGIAGVLVALAVLGGAGIGECLVLLAVLFAIYLFVFWVRMLIHACLNWNDYFEAVLWIFLILTFNLAGAFAYWFFVKRFADQERKKTKRRCRGAEVGVVYELNRDFELVNGTGRTIKEVYIAPTMSDGWQQNLLEVEEVMADGSSTSINITSDERDSLWDMKVVWQENLEDVVWQSLNLSRTSKLILRYNEQSGEASVEQQ